MNKEELIGKLQMVYVGDKNALNELIGYYNGLKEVIEIVQQENKQLKDNWNKLKEIAKSQSDFKLKIRNKELWFEVDELLSKMQELERSNNILKEVE